MGSSGSQPKQWTLRGTRTYSRLSEQLTGDTHLRHPGGGNIPVSARPPQANPHSRWRQPPIGQRRSGSAAPIRLIYVVDLDKFKTAGFPEPGLYDPEIQKSYYFVDTGLIAQNVYLAASALGLASWFHNCNKAELTKVLKLTSQQRPLFGHTVGYPGARGIHLLVPWLTLTVARTRPFIGKASGARETHGSQLHLPIPGEEGFIMST